MSKTTARRLVGLLLVVLSALCGTVAAGGEASAQAEPRLSHLGIAIWPEFDRPQGGLAFDDPPALVIIQGELAPDTTLPTRLSLRIPTAAGEPWAVASAASPSAGLEDLEYETTAQGDSLLITLETPDPIIYLEFYVPISSDGIEREFTYVWHGDLASDEITLQAQIPLGAEDFQAEPELGPAGVGQYGLLYRETTLGGLDASQSLSFRIQYTKEDSNLSFDALAAAQPDDDGGGVPLERPVLAAIAAAALLGIAALAWYRHSRIQPAAVRTPRGETAGGAGYCTQCGHALSPEDRFCSRCGAPARRR